MRKINDDDLWHTLSSLGVSGTLFCGKQNVLNISLCSVHKAMSNRKIVDEENPRSHCTLDFVLEAVDVDEAEWGLCRT